MLWNTNGDADPNKKSPPIAESLDKNGTPK
jgi:hypothetical protein